MKKAISFAKENFCRFLPHLTLISLLVLTGASAFADDETENKLSAEKFLEITRKPPGRECWAMLDGKITHERRGGEPEEAPLYLGIRFTPERTVAQVIINNDEGYRIGQQYKADKDATTVITEKADPDGKSFLAEFGLKPEDLAMSFLFWKFIKELEPDTARGQDCRVFLLESPDAKERVKVYISSKHYFPLQVEWFKTGEDKSYRSLEVDSFKQQDDFAFVTCLICRGPGWKTTIDFTDYDGGYFSQKQPVKDLFRKLAGKDENKNE